MDEVNKKEKKPVMDGYAAIRTIRQVLDSRLEQLPDQRVFGSFPIANILQFKRPLV